MANLAINDIIRATVICSNPVKNQVTRNQFYYQVTNIVGVWTPLTAAQAMSNSHSLVYKPWLCETAEYVETAVRRIDPGPTPDSSSQSGRGFGTSGPTMIPGQVCGLISCEEDSFHQGSLTPKHPEGTLQSSTGRAYIPFPATAFIGTNTSGTMTAAGKNVLLSIASLVYTTRTLLNTGASLTLSPRIKNDVYDRTVTPNTKVTFWREVENHSASALWATQKSRGDRGQHEVLPN